MSFLIEAERTSNKAADTGTAAHLAVSLYHKGQGVDSALADMRARVSEFQEADLDEAEKFARAYFRDPRNPPEAVVESELLVTFKLPAHPNDPTGKPIYFQGTCDQIRRGPGNYGYQIWDYKTGKDDGWIMLHAFAPQLAGYAIGVDQNNMFPEPVSVGGIIRARGYHSRGEQKPENSPGGVFFETGMSLGDCFFLMNRLRFIVAGIRSGEPLFGPGDLCGHCPHGGLGDCMNRARELGVSLL